MQNKQFYRRNLPHINPLGGTYFTTFCLKDTLTQPEIIRLMEAHKKRTSILKSNPKTTDIELDKESRRQFGELDNAIHKAKGNHYLKNEKLAQEVANAIHHWDDKRIDLMSYCIMSNQVHLVFTLLREDHENLNVFLVQVLKSIKNFSAKACNKILGIKGQFWQRESYDRLVRSREELHRIISYTLDNPVKAGLCKNRSDWKSNYIKEEYNEFM